MGVLFCIDYHSLRAREYVFLLELVSKYEKAGGKLSFYPNFAFAVALAKYFLEKDGLALDDSNRFAAETSEKILGQVSRFKQNNVPCGGLLTCFFFSSGNLDVSFCIDGANEQAYKQIHDSNDSLVKVCGVAFL